MNITIKPTIKQNVCFKRPFLDTISQCPKLHSYIIYLSHGESKRHRRQPQPAAGLEPAAGNRELPDATAAMIRRSGEDKSRSEEHKAGAALLQSQQEGAAAARHERNVLAITHTEVTSSQERQPLVTCSEAPATHQGVFTLAQRSAAHNNRPKGDNTATVPMPAA